MQYGETKDRVYINLHADEVTSIQAAASLLEKQGGLFIRIENNKQRNIRFRLRGRYYVFDPNRIFSREGIMQTLGQLSHISEPAIEEIEKFAARILQLIPSNPSFIIALHNNTNGKFGVNSYLPGAERQHDALRVYADPGQDIDDIFFTTDSLLYNRLSAEKFNTILQDNEKVRRDGSLSVYCGERNIPYLNCETEHGKIQQYMQMLSVAVKHIGRMNAFISYQYTVNTDGVSSPAIGRTIYFGNKKIGELRLAKTDSIQGLLEIEKKFQVYSNMDFFLVQQADGGTTIEVRIDPTREKILLDAAKDIIVMGALPGSIP